MPLQNATHIWVTRNIQYYTKTLSKTVRQMAGQFWRLSHQLTGVTNLLKPMGTQLHMKIGQKPVENFRPQERTEHFSHARTPMRYAFFGILILIPHKTKVLGEFSLKALKPNRLASKHFHTKVIFTNFCEKIPKFSVGNYQKKNFLKVLN